MENDYVNNYLFITNAKINYVNNIMTKFLLQS